MPPECPEDCDTLVARHLEANGIPTVLVASARDITAQAFAPRAVFVNYPLGNTTGRPDDPENQRAILRAALKVLASASRPGEIVGLPYSWLPDDDSWMERVYTDAHDTGEHPPTA